MPAKTILFLLFSLLLLQRPLHAQSNIINIDSSARVSLTPDTALISQFRTQPDFIYFKQVKEEVSSWWQEFLSWLINLLGTIFSTSRIFGKLLYAALIGLFIFLIIRLFAGRFQTIMAKQSNEIQEWNVLHESENPEDLNSKIELEIEKGNFRMAIRILYMQILLKMDTKKFIRLKKEKTGRNYLDEIINNDIRNQFREINYAFEYTWYGEFNPDKETFNSIRSQFEQLKNILQ